MKKNSRKRTDIIFRNYARKIINSDRYILEKKYIQHAGVSCYLHSIAVAYYSILILEKLHVRYDRKSLVRGALLHDYFLYDWHKKDNYTHRLHGFHHSKTALKNASEDYVLTEREKNIIARHMFPLTPVPPRYREAVIVCIVDKVCSIAEIIRWTKYVRCRGWRMERKCRR